MDIAARLDRIAADLTGVVRFFTRLPVPALARSDDAAALPRFETAGWALPAAGAILALPAACLAALLSASGLPPLASGALVVALLALVGGGMGEDGLADTADGLCGGHDRERRLAIMKDSRIGVFGGTALALSLVVRAALLGALVADGALPAFAGTVAAAAVGKGGLLALWSRLPPARPDGLSAAAGRPAARAAAIGLALAGILSIVALAAAGPAGWVAGLCLAAAAVALLGHAARRTVGGQTGDILGAAGLVAEMAFLVGLLA